MSKGCPSLPTSLLCCSRHPLRSQENPPTKKNTQVHGNCSLVPINGEFWTWDKAVRTRAPATARHSSWDLSVPRHPEPPSCPEAVGFRHVACGWGGGSAVGEKGKNASRFRGGLASVLGIVQFSWVQSFSAERSQTHIWGKIESIWADHLLATWE